MLTAKFGSDLPLRKQLGQRWRDYVGGHAPLEGLPALHFLQKVCNSAIPTPFTSQLEGVVAFQGANQDVATLGIYKSPG